MTKITELLGIEYPIFQGAMAQVSRYQLAAAVSEAGGLGIIASGGMSKEMLEEQIEECLKLTNKPFGVNLMLMAPNCDELVDVIVEKGVKIVTTGAGTPKKYMDTFKANNIKVIPVIPNVAIAKKMEALGVDAIVAEGTEAGGHIGELATMALVPQIVDAVSIPVIAAGGIADGRAVAAAYALGAEGVQVGTAFLVAEECPVPAAFKEAVLAATDTSTVVTGRKNGAPVRGLRNKMTEKYIQYENENMPREALEELTMGSSRKAAIDGDVENGSIMAGQISGLLHEVRPAKEIIATMFHEANTIIDKLQNKKMK